MAFNEEMKEDRKHIRTRLEELRAQKFEMLKKRNEEMIRKNWENLPKTQAFTAPAGDADKTHQVHDFGLTKPAPQMSHQKWGNLSLTSNAFYCDRTIQSHAAAAKEGATTSASSTKNVTL